MRSIIFLLAVCLVTSGSPGTVRAAPSAHRDPIGTLLLRVQKNARSMRGAVDLWRLMERRGQADGAQRKKIGALMRALAGRRQAPLALRRLAVRFWSQLLRSRGKSQDAQRVLERLGLVRNWWVIGPFDNEGHRGFDTAFGPERQIDLDRQETGKVRPLRWRPLPEQPPDGRILLHPLFSPRTRSAAYALAAVQVPGRIPALLHLGCDDACKVWINRKLVLSDPGVHPFNFDQRTLALRLSKGYNLILVKITQEEGAWGFSLSLTDRRGNPLPLKAAGTREELTRALAAMGKPPGEPRPIPSLADWFWNRAQNTRRDPLFLAEAALALTRTTAFDQKQQRADDLVHRSLECLTDRHPSAVQVRLLLAQATSNDNLGRRLLREAAKLDPARPEPHSRLGIAHHVRNELDKAWVAHARALRAEPGHLPSELENIELFFKLGLGGFSLVRLETLLKRHPEVPDVLMVAANLHRRMGHVRRARGLYADLVTLEADSQLALRALFELATARGDVPGALAWLDRLQRLDPLRAGWWIERGDLLLYNKKPLEALRAYRRAVAVCPEEAMFLVREGLALQALGRTAECLERWKTAQALSPQDRDLERHIQSMQPRRQAFYQPWAVDPTENPIELPAREPSSDSGTGTIRLLDQTVVRLLPNGMTSSYRQQLIGILSARGADHARTFRIEYAPARQQIRILHSRVIHSDGRLDSSLLVNDFSLSEPWYNLYYDVHAREVTFPSLEPGDLVELSYLVDDVGSQTLLGEYFGDLVPFQFAEPARKISYVLLAPEKFSLYTNLPRGGRHRQMAGRNGTVIHTWEAENMGAVEPEPDMPGFTETHSFLHISTHQSWPELASWYYGLVSDQLVAGPEVKRLAQTLVEGIDDPKEKIRAIHRFVADRTRYVGLEFGIHSYVPYQASQVLQRKFGDCKDKSALLVAMFNQVGIKAHLALVRMNQLGRIPKAPASLAVFNHALCYLPDHGLWLDATASFHDIDDLPTQDQNVQALVISRNGGRLVQTPGSTPDRNRTEIAFDVFPGPQGGARVLSRVAVRGSVAPAMRAQLSGSATRKAAIEKIMNELFPGAQVSSVEVENLKRPDLPLVSVSELTLPVTTGMDGQVIDVPVLGKNTTYQKIFTPYQERSYDLLLAPPWSVNWTISISPPPGYRFPELPGDARKETAFGRAEISYRQEEERVLIRAGFRLNQRRIPASDYSAFRDFLGRVDLLFGRRLRFTRSQDAGS